VNDEWRLEVTFDRRSGAQAITGRLAAGEVRHDLKREFGEAVIVSRDGSKIFVYAASREQITKAGESIAGDAERHGWEARSSLKRWHSLEELWKDPESALPSTDEARREERESLMARERAAVRLAGYPEFEVRVELPSHHDAIDLARLLDKEGLLTIRRWRYLVLGATDEDDARALADRILEEAPSETRVRVEGTRAAIAHNWPSPVVVM
jgi:hypothetical protein